MRLELKAAARIGAKLLFVLLTISCFAHSARATDLSRGAVIMHLARPGAHAIGDLDGDHRPDVASGIFTTDTSKGHLYRIDLDLSASAETRSFSVFSEDSSGLDIALVDIDGDHDLDVVISGRMSLRPIGIWLNDGTGRFTATDLKQYGMQIPEAVHIIESPGTLLTVALHFERRRSQPGNRCERPDSHKHDPCFEGSPFACSTAIQVSAGIAPLRAPPSSTF